MKILIVVPYLYPAMAYGGPAKVVYDLAMELGKKNSVNIFTSDAWNADRRILEREKLQKKGNVEITYFRNLINSIAYRHRIFTPLGMIFVYLKQKNRFDVVHINDVFIFTNLIIGYLALLYKKSYVFSTHGVLDPIRLKRKFIFKAVVYRLLARTVLKGAKNIIATSDAEKGALERAGYRNIVTVFNGVPTHEFQPSKIFRKFKNNRRFTLLYVGKIHPLKGLRELVEALKGVVFPFQLLIAGPDDGDLVNIKRLISRYKLRNIFFLGFVDDNEKAELFNLSDLFIYPSLSEGFSISILEAMTYRLPVLITDACNFPDIEKYRAGIVVKAGETLVPNIGKNLNLLEKNRKLLRSMGANARRLVVSKYSIGYMADQILKVYNSQ